MANLLKKLTYWALNDVKLQEESTWSWFLLKKEHRGHLIKFHLQEGELRRDFANCALSPGSTRVCVSKMAASS